MLKPTKKAAERSSGATSSRSKPRRPKIKSCSNGRKKTEGKMRCFQCSLIPLLLCSLFVLPCQLISCRKNIMSAGLKQNLKSGATSLLFNQNILSEGLQCKSPVLQLSEECSYQAHRCLEDQHEAPARDHMKTHMM